MISRRVMVLIGLVTALLGARIAVSLSRGGGPAGIGERLLEGLDTEAVFRIRLRRGDQRVALERDPQSPTGWVVASHGRVPARQDACEALLQRLAGWRRERVAGSDETRHAEWAVDDAQARRIRLEDAQGRPLAALMVGRITGLDRDRAKEGGYGVQVDTLGLFVREATLADGEATFGAQVVVVNEFVVRELEPVARGWFMRPLLLGKRPDVTQIKVRQGAHTLSVKLRPPPARLEGDPRPPDPAKAFGLLTYLWLLEPLGPAPPGAAPRPDAGVSIELTSAERTQTVTLWSAEGRHYARVGKVAVEVNAHEAERALSFASVDGLVRRRITTLTAGDLGRFHWEDPAGEAAVVRGERGGWTATVTGPGVPLRSGSPSRAKVDEVARALTQLNVLRWETTPARAEAALEPVEQRIVLAERRSRARVVIELGPVKDGRRAARIGGVTLPAWVDAAALEEVRRRVYGLAPQ